MQEKEQEENEICSGSWVRRLHIVTKTASSSFVGTGRKPRREQTLSGIKDTVTFLRTFLTGSWRETQQENLMLGEVCGVQFWDTLDSLWGDTLLPVEIAEWWGSMLGALSYRREN